MSFLDFNILQCFHLLNVNLALSILFSVPFSSIWVLKITTNLLNLSVLILQWSKPGLFSRIFSKSVHGKRLQTKSSHLKVYIAILCFSITTKIQTILKKRKKKKRFNCQGFDFFPYLVTIILFFHHLCQISTAVRKWHNHAATDLASSTTPIQQDHFQWFSIAYISNYTCVFLSKVCLITAF